MKLAAGLLKQLARAFGSLHDSVCNASDLGQEDSVTVCSVGSVAVWC